jgi:hypothetical protein
MAREDPVVLRELAGPAYGGFNWGYTGSGPERAAAAILADALSLGDPVACGLDPAGAITPDRTLGMLRYDFCWDVVSQLAGEWRLRRGALLRWARGWYAQRELTDLPRAVARLPSIGVANPYDPSRSAVD